MRRVLRHSLLLVLFWLVGLSLGYPSVNRYQPGPPALGDATYYAEMVETGITQMRDVGHWFTALLVVNAGFCAAAALVLYIMGTGVLGGTRHGLAAAFLFLVNFNTANLYLSGLVDSAEICLLSLVLMALWRGRWGLLPLLGLFGGAAKETFVGFAGLLAGGWWLAGLAHHGLRPRLIMAVAAMGIGALAVVIALWSGLSGHLVLPGGIAESYLAERTLIQRLGDLAAYLSSRAFWYTFAWLLPLAALGARSLPREFLWAAAVSLAGALFMAAWANAGDNIGRPLFAAAGPIMVIAAAAGLARLTESDDA
ncbi:MAG: hypothetical protein HY055_00205 [Magnetospirillum sp.]|nr:hypothetical protein [Magnetospirillum sp.]